MKSFFYRALKKLNSRDGQTFILVTTVTAMATVLGVMAMSGALMSLRLKGMKRVSDKNFYRLELAVAEMEAGVERDVTDNIDASSALGWSELVLESRMGVRDLSVFDSENYDRMKSRRGSACEKSAEWLESFLVTIPADSSEKDVTDRTEAVSVGVGDIELYNGVVVLKDVTTQLINYERDAEAIVSCDLILRYPANESDGAFKVVSRENWHRIG